MSEEAKVKHMKSQRRGHKSYATKMMEEASKIICECREGDKVKIITYTQVLTERPDAIRTLNDQILETIVDDEEIEKEITESAEYHMRMQEILVGLTEALSKLAANDETREVSEGGTLSSRTSHENAKLPKIQLKYFSGDVLSFQEFWESYNSAVHSNHKLDDVTKFNSSRGLL